MLETVTQFQIKSKKIMQKNTQECIQTILNLIYIRNNADLADR